MGDWRIFSQIRTIIGSSPNGLSELSGLGLSIIDVLKSCHWPSASLLDLVEELAEMPTALLREGQEYRLVPACHVLYLHGDVMHGGGRQRILLFGCSTQRLEGAKVVITILPGVQKSAQKRRFEARMSAGSVVVLPSTWNSTAQGVSPRTQACRRLFPFSACCRTQSSIPLRASEMAFALR